MNLVEQIKNEAPKYRTQQEIADALGCSNTYVSKILAGETRFNRKAKIQVAFLWGADVGPTEISEKLGLKVWRVIKFLRDEGLIDAKP